MPLHGEASYRPTYTNLRPARGGTLLVTEAYHEVFGTWHVQKTVPISSGSVAFREPRLLEQLDHTYIVKVTEAQFDPDLSNHITFVMPRYDGGSVAHRLADGHVFSVSQAMEIARNVLAGLDHLHIEHGYVHRDIKGDNILLDGSIAHGYLADMELAEIIGPNGSAPLTIGTYAYLAPECIPSVSYSPAADIYGVGMILHEMLSGRFEWENLDMSLVEERVSTGRRSLPDRYFSNASFAPIVPPALRSVIRKTVSRSLDTRYASAADVIRSLNRIEFIDWRHVVATPSANQWDGSWPPHLPTDQRTTYRIKANLLDRGPNAGRLRATATYLDPGATSERRLRRLPDRAVDSGDVDSLASLFREVEQRAAQRTPAR